MKKGKFRLLFSLLAFVLIASAAIILSKAPREYPGLPKDLSGKVDPTQKTGIYEGKVVNVPDSLLLVKNPPVLGVSNSNRWIEIDLSEQKVRAWDGNGLFLESLISTGLPWFPTPTGEFTIWAKARATKMEGGIGKYYYFLPNVPYVMFFENSEIPGFRGYSLHGTYWHSDFGSVHSHGCVNLPTPIAEKLYFWTDPQMPAGKSFVRTDATNPGTRIVIHD